MFVPRGNASKNMTLYCVIKSYEKYTHLFLGSKKIQKLLLWFRNGLGIVVMTDILVNPSKT